MRVTAVNLALKWQKIVFFLAMSLPGPAPSFLEGAVSTDIAAKRTAAMWMSNATNKMSLSHVNKAADTDGDGLLNAEEFQQMFIKQGSKANAAKLFAQVDKDGDGQLDEEELKQVYSCISNAARTPRLHVCVWLQPIHRTTLCYLSFWRSLPTPIPPSSRRAMHRSGLRRPRRVRVGWVGRLTDRPLSFSLNSHVRLARATLSRVFLEPSGGANAHPVRVVLSVSCYVECVAYYCGSY